MHPVERVVRNLGGIASTAEILQVGYDTQMIRLVASYGKIVPVRRGWYAVPEVPLDSLRAWRAGGRLSCISAAAHHGLWQHPVEALHVRVAANASRVERSAGVVPHWRRGPVTGTRLAVSVDEALATIRRCQPADVFHAIRRAANR